MKFRNTGWYGESYRHSLAARGIKTRLESPRLNFYYRYPRASGHIKQEYFETFPVEALETKSPEERKSMIKEAEKILDNPRYYEMKEIASDEKLLSDMVSEFDKSEPHEGSVWDFARTKTSGNDNDGNYDAWDFATALAPPHAPIMWAYNAAFGDKENIGSFTPMSRIARNAATLLGVEDWNNSQWNLEAKVRGQMGLPAFDKWDDYRIDRSLANLAADGSFSVDEVKEAMAISALVQQGKLTPKEAKEMSEAYREGVKRSYQEYTGGAAAFGLSFWLQCHFHS